MRIEKHLPQLDDFSVLSQSFNETAGEALLLLRLAVEKSLEPVGGERSQQRLDLRDLCTHSFRQAMISQVCLGIC